MNSWRSQNNASKKDCSDSKDVLHVLIVASMCYVWILRDQVIYPVTTCSMLSPISSPQVLFVGTCIQHIVSAASGGHMLPLFPLNI